MAKSQPSYPSDSPIVELIHRYEEYMAAKRSDGYFDVEEIETIVEYYLCEGCVEEAHQALLFGMRLHPSSKELLLKRAKMLLRQGDISEALQILESQFSPHAYESLLLRVEAYSKLNRLEEADNIASTLIANAPNNKEFACLDVVDVFMDSECYSQALHYIHKGLSFSPNNIDLLFAKAYCLEKTDDFDGAIQTYHEIINQDSYIEEAWFNLGQVHFTRQNYSEALHAYTMCITIDEDDTLAWLQKGHVHFFEREIEEAITCYSKCLDSYEDKWQLYIFLAECYTTQEDYETALQFFQKSLAENPNNYKALIGVGLCELEKNNYADARRHFSEAAELNPESDEAWFYLGEIESFQQNQQEALNYYLKAFQYNTLNTDLLMTIGSVYCDLDQYDKAIPYYQRALETAENPPIVQLSVLLAICYYEQHDYDTTLYYLEKASKINQEALELFFNCIPEAMETLSSIIKEKKNKK